MSEASKCTCRCQPSFARRALRSIAASIPAPFPRCFMKLNRTPQNPSASRRRSSASPATVGDAELRRLDALGFCGVRFNFMKHLGKGAGIEAAIDLSARLAKLGWHLQVHFDASLIEELAPWLKRSAVPVVIDHMGRVDASLGLEQPAFRRLLDLMRDPRFWVKVSGSERISREAAPWEDAIPFARTLVAEFPERTLWGSDWPHPNLAAVPDDGVLVDLLSEIAPSEAQRRALLVENPKRFYRFPRKLKP